METCEEAARKRGSKTLLVHHLPAELTEDEKEDLLKYFGAESVRVFSNFGRMKHAAFAAFRSEKAAEKALTRLHQLEILNRKLIVEFAKGQDNITVLKDPPVTESNKHDVEAKNKQETKQPNVPLIETGIAPSLGESSLCIGDDHRASIVDLQLVAPVNPTETNESKASVNNNNNNGTEDTAGFGKLYPSTQTFQQCEERSDDEQDLLSDVITRKELEKGRLSRDEIKRMSVFKNYEPGEPTCRLYVKNIAKPVEEKDLKYIYGRYIDPASETERNMFDVLLMKEGRMKGQAFVGLPSETSAEKALRETNGFVLYDKPLVVQFARSARPKQDNADAKKGAKQR
ncbi:RNA-binding region-containing protein 3 [Nerophis ophidion]|uniref:RNA-binding region-containing protein 3 n=1 Tax=Nerophis ophidion TaxID=159077 RepID=UPI002ADF67B7|nr:RNA-binding region-containing protein 3 [Nerophis ophidion]